ncbi:MAG: DUF479 domain-containing protein [Mariniphaga sp.]|nr:DUF479 domain-containing protein [Mariniphaga sp.]
MNFLAHLYLSGEDDGLVLGNFIGDYIKGSKYMKYPVKIQRGIIMHRKIDSFTDTHPLIKESSIFFKPGYGRYSGIIVDVLFDHFLAQNWNEFSAFQLGVFTRNAHALFLSNFLILPLKVKRFLPFLIQSKRLESYSSTDGLYKALEIMAHYTSLPGEQEYAMNVLKENKSELLDIFYRFMRDIINYVESDFDVNIKKPEGYSN